MQRVAHRQGNGDSCQVIGGTPLYGTIFLLEASGDPAQRQLFRGEKRTELRCVRRTKSTGGKRLITTGGKEEYEGPRCGRGRGKTKKKSWVLRSVRNAC